MKSIQNDNDNSKLEGDQSQQPASLEVDIGTDRGPRQAYWITVYHLFIFVAAIVLTLLTYKGKLTADDVMKKAIYTFSFGAVGGTVTASRYVIYSVRHSIYDYRRLLWQLMTPLHSALLAGVAIIAVKSGLFTLGQPLSPDEPKHTLAIMAFSFFVGLASESFVKRLIVAIQALFGERGDLEIETSEGRVEKEVIKSDDDKTKEK